MASKANLFIVAGMREGRIEMADWEVVDGIHGIGSNNNIYHLLANQVSWLIGKFVADWYIAWYFGLIGKFRGRLVPSLVFWVYFGIWMYMANIFKSYLPTSVAD